MKFTIVNSEAERREGLKALLRHTDRRARFNEAKDWRQAASAVLRLDPDMIVIDWHDAMRMADLRTLLNAFPKIPAAIIVDEASTAQVRLLLSAGVLGVVPRNLDPTLIVRALEMVLLGGHYVPVCALDPELEPVFLPRRDASPKDFRKGSKRFNTLSIRQQQIIRAVKFSELRMRNLERDQNSWRCDEARRQCCEPARHAGSSRSWSAGDPTHRACAAPGNGLHATSRRGHDDSGFLHSSVREWPTEKPSRSGLSCRSTTPFRPFFSSRHPACVRRCVKLWRPAVQAAASHQAASSVANQRYARCASRCDHAPCHVERRIPRVCGDAPDLRMRQVMSAGCP